MTCLVKSHMFMRLFYIITRYSSEGLTHPTAPGPSLSPSSKHRAKSLRCRTLKYTKPHRVDLQRFAAHTVVEQPVVFPTTAYFGQNTLSTDATDHDDHGWSITPGGSGLVWVGEVGNAAAAIIPDSAAVPRGMLLPYIGCPCQ